MLGVQTVVVGIAYDEAKRPGAHNQSYL
jgi:hypothetical protein